MTTFKIYFPRVFDFMVAAVLVFAGSLKLLDVEPQPVVFGKWIVPGYLILLAAEFEILMGIWLVTGVGSQQARVVAMTLFCWLAVMSGYNFLVGVERCTCLGSQRMLTLSIRAWMVFGFDLFTIIGFIVAIRCRRRV